LVRFRFSAIRLSRSHEPAFVRSVFVGHSSILAVSQ
jgi:hypothetical protein